MHMHDGWVKDMEEARRNVFQGTGGVEETRNHLLTRSDLDRVGISGSVTEHQHSR
jgi:hypothetical protein